MDSSLKVAILNTRGGIAALNYCFSGVVMNLTYSGVVKADGLLWVDDTQVVAL